MSWQDDAMAEQEQADALFDMGEAEWRDTFEERRECNKKYWKGYWKEHREEISKKRKERYKKDKDKILERNGTNTNVNTVSEKEKILTKQNKLDMLVVRHDAP